MENSAVINNQTFLAKKKKSRIELYQKTYLFLLLLPLMLYLGSQLGSTMIYYAGNVTLIINALLIFSLFLLLYGICGRTKLAGNILIITMTCVTVLDALLIQVRGNPAIPTDILSLKTALSVSKHCSIQLDYTLVIGLIIFAIALFFSNKVQDIRISGKSKRIILLLGIISTIGIGSFASFGPFFQEHPFSKEIQGGENGLFPSFIHDFKNFYLPKPDGYSKSNASMILSDNSAEQTVPEDCPDIVVIMDEAFSNLGSLSSTLQNDPTYIPFVKSILNGSLDNTISGKMNVSILGSNTADTEWEFLTGHTMAFMPEFSVPYQQYVHNDSDLSTGLPAQLKSYGYQTTAMHPYGSSGYNRDVVYTLMGFDNLLFKDQFEAVEQLRGFCTDKAVFDKISNVLENKSNPQFVFAVTMQNHATYENTEEMKQITTQDLNVPTELVHEYFEGQNALNNYCSLENITDQSLQEFIEKIDSSDKHTIVVFFGDHQPSSDVSGEASDFTYDDVSEIYQVPFFIHANYDIGENKTDVNISPNFLANDMLQAAGLPLNEYRNYLESVRQYYSSISSIDTISLQEDPDQNIINTYNQVQYYLLTK